jgi:hypothetical protein
MTKYRVSCQEFFFPKNIQNCAQILINCLLLSDTMEIVRYQLFGGRCCRKQQVSPKGWYICINWHLVLSHSSHAQMWDAPTSYWARLNHKGLRLANVENEIHFEMSGYKELIYNKIHTLVYINITISILDVIHRKKISKKVNYPCNRAWRPMGLRKVKAPTFFRQSGHRWWLTCQPYTLAALWPQKEFLRLISVRGWVNPGP